MLQLDLNIEWHFGHVNLKAEELDSHPDDRGFVRYAVAADRRQSLIYVNMNYYRPPLIFDRKEIKNYFEELPAEHPPFYSEEEIFTPREVGLIASAIGLYLLQEQSGSLRR